MSPTYPVAFATIPISPAVIRVTPILSDGHSLADADVGHDDLRVGGGADVLSTFDWQALWVHVRGQPQAKRLQKISA